MLATRGWLASLIREAAGTDPGWAGALAQFGQTVYPGLERELTSPEPAGHTWPPHAQDPASLAAVLDLLIKLQHMLPPSEPPPGMAAQARARLALGCGGMFRGRRLLDTLLRDEDPRVRANAVEALWFDPPREYIPVLRELSRDPAHRVAANALVGLLLAGEEEALAMLVDMVERSEGVARLAAIWAMGRTGDTRFHAYLKQWRLRNRNETAALRGSLAAMVRLRQAEALCRSRNIKLTILAAAASSGEFLIHALPHGAGSELRGACLQPWLGETPVWNYRAVWEAAPPDCRLLFILPPGAARQEWEQHWSQVQGAFSCAAAFDPGGVDGGWTHALCLGEGAAPAPGLPGLTPETRVFHLPAPRGGDPAVVFDALREVLRGVWAVRLPEPAPGGPALTLRIASPQWSAGPVAASAGASA